MCKSQSPHPASHVRIPSTASSVRSVKAAFPLIASAHQLCHSARQDHQDHPDHQDKKDRQVSPEVPDSQEDQENKEHHAQLKTLLASNAQQALTVHPDHPAQLVDQETMDNPEIQDKEAAADHPAHQDHPDRLDNPDNPEVQVNQDSQDKTELDLAASQDPRDHPAQPEIPEDQVNPEVQDNQAEQGHPVHQVLQVNPDNQEVMDIQDNLDQPAFLAQMQHTAPAPVGPPFLCAFGPNPVPDIYNQLNARRKANTRKKKSILIYCINVMLLQFIVSALNTSHKELF